MRTLQNNAFRHIGSIAAIALGLGLAACDEEDSGTGNEQLGAVPEGAEEVAPPAAAPEPDPMIEDSAPDQPAQ